MESIIRDIHAVSGIVVGSTGIIQILAPKGGKIHRILGNAYFWAWLPLIVTGSIMGSFIIALFGILGWYSAYMGFRFGRLKNVNLNNFDKGVIVAAVVLALCTLAGGIYLFVLGKAVFAGVSFFFGIIFFLVTWSDVREFILLKANRRLSGHKMFWYFEHYGRMFISFMAAMTAFTVINEVFPIEWLNWIMPTVVGTALLILQNRRFFRKFRIDGKN